MKNLKEIHHSPSELFIPIQVLSPSSYLSITFNPIPVQSIGGSYGLFPLFSFSPHPSDLLPLLSNIFFVNLQKFKTTSESYHGVGCGQESDKVKKITKDIYNDRFKPGLGQVHKSCEDMYHPGQKVGEGVYCTPKIKTAEGYSGITNIKGKNYKTVLMVRVKPDKIRACKYREDFWVVSGANDEISPYRILYKCEN